MNASFVRTGSVLDRILAHKQETLARARREQPMAQLREACAAQPAPRDFSAALRRDTVALIAECKQASPSAGLLSEDYDPARLASIYAANGAAAISVLTDERFFRGSLQDLSAVRAAVAVPVLCKDFVLDAWQVLAARAAGADAVLLIAAALADEQLAELQGQIHALGMTVLVEVHNEAELMRALALEPRLVGINNRNLKTFDVDLNTTERLARQVPAETLLVAESGIEDAADVRRMGRLGARAVLVGEALMRASDPAAGVRMLASVKREHVP